MHQAQRYLPSQPRRSLPAKLLTATDLPCTPDVPGIDLAQTRAATRRTTPPRPLRRIRFWLPSVSRGVIPGLDSVRRSSPSSSKVRLTTAAVRH